MCISKNKISVIIPSYNYEQYIENTINSVLNQTYNDIELIIVDDGSTDNSINIIYKYCNKDSRIKFVQHADKKNHGLSETLQLGIKSSDGDFIAILEADDLWSPKCLELRLAAIKEEAGVIFNDIDPIVMEGSNLEWFNAYVPRVMKKHKQKAIIKDNQYKIFEMKWEFMVENVIPTFSCTMVKKNLLEKCDFNPPVQQWLDRWLWCQLAQMTKFQFIPYKLSYWRLHKDSYNNINQQNNKSALSILVKYIKTYSRFLKSLKEQIIIKNSFKKFPHFILLYVPAFFYLVLRMLFYIRYIGIKNTTTVIIKKILPIKNKI